MTASATPSPCQPSGADEVMAALADRIGLSPAAAPARRARASLDGMTADALARLARDLRSRRSTAEIEALVEIATNHETYLFRDRGQLALLERDLTAQLRAERRPRDLRIWSAGCSAGDEAYSLVVVAVRAMIAAGLASMDADGDVWFVGGASITAIGTDISARTIALTSNPLFRTGPVASLRSATAGDLFLLRPVPDGHVPGPVLRRCVRFAQGNILDGPPPGGPFDVVACRNVLVYFADGPRARAMEVLSGATAPGGRLLLGPTDGAPALATFQRRHDAGAILHVRAT